jgi:site-specific DNA recombinase
MEKGDNVILYTRVSTKEQAEHGYSLPYQKKFLDDFCGVRGLNVIAHFEEDYSAKTFGRPEWRKLMELVKAKRKQVDSIVFVRWDRFSRNLSEALLVIDELQAMGITVNSAEQPLDLGIPDNRLLLAIYLATPEIENIKNSQRTKNGSYQARMEGCWTGTAPFGYTNHRNELRKSTLIIEPSAADLVRLAFTEMSKGVYSAEEVRRKLKEKGRGFSKQVFLNLLRNVAYTGKVSVKAYGKKDSAIVEGLHDPIIPEELFNEVQDVLSGRTRKTAYKQVKRTDDLSLRGFLKCKNCGGNLTGSKSKGRSESYFYYHCNNNTCRERFRADQANDDFLEYLQEFQFKDEVVSAYYLVLEDVFNQHEQERFAEIKSLETEVERLKQLSNTVQDRFFEELITQGVFKEATDRYNAKQNELIMQITELKGQESEFRKYVRYALPLLSDLPKYYGKAFLEVKQKVLSVLFPEKFEYENNEYRTASLNEVLYLMILTNNDLHGTKKRAGLNPALLSCMAPPSGLEPETL